jgi:hypothetical protein
MTVFVELFVDADDDDDKGLWLINKAVLSPKLSSKYTTVIFFSVEFSDDSSSMFV